MADEHTYYWMHNENFTSWELFCVKDYNHTNLVPLLKDYNRAGKEWNEVRVVEYAPEKQARPEDPGCPLVPVYGRRFAVGECSRDIPHDTAQKRWTDLVQEGYRMLVETTGVINRSQGFETVWLTLNRAAAARGVRV